MDYRNLQREQLEEISRSDWLAEDFADHIQEDFLISAPPDLKSSVIRRCAQPDVQLAAGARSLSRRTRLLLYSLKVGAAVAASVLLLALLPSRVSSSIRGKSSLRPFPMWLRPRITTS